MKGKYLRRLGGLILATLMLAGIAFISPSSVQAQRRRRIVVVRPIYRPFGPWGYGYGYRRWGYDPWSPYGGMYRQYVFSNGDDAVSQGYKDGFKTGKDDGKKNKSYDPSALTITMTQALATLPKSTDQASHEAIRKDTKLGAIASDKN